ncbi:MAG: HD domain-containing protein [Spirochaetes bacterium]|nr:HD domain-containing protein [Spirochaetota bacterium]MBN2772382.1 HD domain-containing protein [Spirochaetota bacterium]
MNNPDLKKRIAFIEELEKLKLVYRQNVAVDGSRQENSAEHSWHIAVMAIVLHRYSDFKDLDLLKVLKMLLIHDIVEIDAGDTFLYDNEANKSKEADESLAASRIFGLLPEDTKNEFISLWKEFENRESPEAKFAASLDGMQPIMNHYLSNGKGIRKHKLKTGQIIEKKKYIADASRELWDYAKEVIDKSESAGLYSKDE